MSVWVLLFSKYLNTGCFGGCESARACAAAPTERNQGVARKERGGFAWLEPREPCKSLPQTTRGKVTREPRNGTHAHTHTNDLGVEARVVGTTRTLKHAIAPLPQGSRGWYHANPPTTHAHPHTHTNQRGGDERVRTAPAVGSLAAESRGRGVRTPAPPTAGKVFLFAA